MSLPSFSAAFTLFKRMSIILVLFTVCRLSFYFYNYVYFQEAPFSIFYYGLFFDLSALFILNSLFILLHIPPFDFTLSKPYQYLLKTLFFVVNIPALLLNCIDMEYFKYTGKRSTADFLDLLAADNSDLNQLIAQYIFDFWALLLLFFLLSTALIWGYTKIKRPAILWKKTPINYVKQGLIGLGILSISVLCMRGNVGLKPLNINSAGYYSSSKYVALVLNTPFTIIKTIQGEYLEDYTFFTDEELKKQFSTIKQFPPILEHKTPPNVVIIILESFSKEYVGALSHRATYTPFLDSLLQEGLSCTNAYANGKKSIEGIPAIVAGLPCLMNTPYITSPYTFNQIKGLPAYLNEIGYQSSFYHGGLNGTMRFDSYCKLAGYSHYFGKNEYVGNKEDYDGKWGIFDEPYLTYFANELKHTKTPFFSTIFTLSSHHPYTLPVEYTYLQKGGKPDLASTITYTDMALRKFFNQIKKEPWFSNTLFVITADHTGVPKEQYYNHSGVSYDQFFGNDVGMYQIPLLFYIPNQPKLKGKITDVVQQKDIMPSILHFLGYPSPFFSFGESIFDQTAKRTAINFLNNNYMLITNDFMLKATPNDRIGLYAYKTDSLLAKNLLPTQHQKSTVLHQYLKAYIQTYNQALIHNKMTEETSFLEKKIKIPQ